MQSQMKTLISQYVSDDFFAGERIPPKKLAAAQVHYPLPRQETVLALVDATIFGSAKNGMAIGLSGVYWNNDWTTESRVRPLSWD